MTADMDLVVVGYMGELRALKLLARSLRLHADTALFGTFHVIINERKPRRFVRAFEADIAPELGLLRSRTRLTPGNELAAGRLKVAGWRSQQSLKLLASRMVEAPNYLILDSKNHFIRPVTQDMLIAPDGRLLSHMYPAVTRFRAEFDNALAYFGVEGIDPDLPILPTSTPFSVRTDIARALVEVVEQREAMPFHRAFMRQRFTEFYLYAAFLLAEPGRFAAHYQPTLKRSASFFRSDLIDPARSATHLAVLERPESFCMGLHRGALPTMSADHKALIATLWQRAGLVENAAEAEEFMRPPEPARAWWRLFG